jgi:hypothetical protein
MLFAYHSKPRACLKTIMTDPWIIIRSRNLNVNEIYATLARINGMAYLLLDL